MKRVSIIVASVGMILSSALAQESVVEQDRKAILAMAGEYKVGFFFKETMSLQNDYTIKPGDYSEEAHEKVFVVSESPTRIELQHVLSAGDQIVKHWSQIWQYEDKEVLAYQFDKTWHKVNLKPEQVKGTWSQLVTQTDDSPRYESYGKWVHDSGSSTWVGSKTRRPLPRREYTKRKDYDYLVAVNRHTVTQKGWFHEQDNLKQIDRVGIKSLLCREVGFNHYQKVADYDFKEVDSYWQEYKPFWVNVKSVWRTFEKENQNISLLKIVDKVSLRSTTRNLIEQFDSSKKVSKEAINKAYKPYVETK